MVDVARVAVIGADLVSAWQNRCLCLLESFVRCYPILSSQDPVECYLASDKIFLFSSCVCVCVYTPVLRTYTVVVYLPLDCCIAAVNTDV